MQDLKTLTHKFEELQEQVCKIIEQSDGTGKFSKENWQKDIGYGVTRVISQGDKIEKGAINFSKVSGPLSKKMSHVLGVQAQSFSATGLSSIFHGKNPFLPSIHMNVRYFSTDNGLEWFGGCMDLTPIYINMEMSGNFHKRLKETCDKYHNSFYPEFKKWADDYFFLPHRNETRGIGGIFFDRQNPGEKINFEQWIHFITDLAELYPVLYSDIMKKNAHIPYNERNIFWQQIRWSRYVEFNLLYDRGTRFGIESGGNTESILISLPPRVKWEYNYMPEKGSDEEKTQKHLKKDIDWINLEND